MKKILFTFFFSLCFTFSFGQVDQAYENKVKQLLEISGGKQAYDVAIKQMFSMFKQQFKHAPDVFWNEFESEFINISMTELTKLIAPVYANHLTSKDLDEIIEFYSSKAGKKLAQSQGAITSESISVGQEWGATIGERVIKKLEENGY
jgi:hypothetical protein